MIAHLPAAPVTRFAPSPTGHLHLGHAYSALVAYDLAASNGGRFLVRMEDIDQTRCRPEFEHSIYEDLSWLGIRWAAPVRRQSDHFADYQKALDRLTEQDLIYPCFCTRKDILQEIAAIGHAPHFNPPNGIGGFDGPIYPGKCRHLSLDERETRVAAGTAYGLRLDIEKAQQLTGGDLWFEDRIAGRVRAAPDYLGDVVLARKDTPTSYHLAVTLDDALQGVTLVTRGVDLFHATHIHRLLQALLDLPTPLYQHHPLLRGPDGKRLAKRDKSETLRAMRQRGDNAESIRRLIMTLPTTHTP